MTILTSHTDVLQPVVLPTTNDAPLVIVVENVSKRYLQNQQRASLRHEAWGMLKRLLRQGTPSTPPAEFWALQNINLTVRAGEALGIVGRNGAGKSTLLRVLSGITSPTKGRVQVKGRFATLIALGAGFNPERTGRENIYLNAAIQGVSPRRLQPMLNDIIEFAELGAFIDQPVKRYSSGMGARLGFSIAIHILPDIVFIDEILAIGDAAFQEKSVGRIMGMKAEKRTLLFVSHTPTAVERLCERSIWIDHGHMIMDGPTSEVLAAYHEKYMPDAAH